MWLFSFHIVKHFIKIFKFYRRVFTKNRDGIKVFCNAKTEEIQDTTVTKIEKSDQSKIRISVSIYTYKLNIELKLILLKRHQRPREIITTAS